MKKILLTLLGLVLFSATLLAADHGPRVAHVTETSKVHTPAPAEPAGLVKIFSNLGPSTDAYNDTIGFYLLGPASSFGFSQFTALPFTPKKNSTVTQVRVPIQWYNDGSADKARLSIYSDNGGVPGTLLAGPKTITPPAGFTCCALTVKSFSPGVSVTAGTQYWVVADTTSTSNFDGLWLIQYPTPITGYDQNGAGWNQNIGYDLGAAGAVYGTVP